MTHIAIITTSFPVDHSGAEAAGSFVYDFAIELAKQTKVSVIAPGEISNVEKQETINIHRFATPSLPLSQLSIIKPHHWVAIYRTIKSGMEVVDSLCKTEKCDYIFALWVLPSGYWARNVMGKYDVRYATWALGSDIWKFQKKPLLRDILKKVLTDADHCFADGYKLKKDVENVSGRSCHFLPSARKINYMQNKEKRNGPPYRLAYLGRWHPNKGVDLLLDSLDRLDEIDWNKIEEIRICGGGQLESKVSQSINILKLKSKPVVQAGYLSKEAAIDLLTWADYLLIPSRIESIPVIFSDAIQCGTPVISMPVGDLPELVEGANAGILAADVSAAAFSEAIKKGLNSSPVNYQGGLENLAKTFNIKNIVNQFLTTIAPDGSYAEGRIT